MELPRYLGFSSILHGSQRHVKILVLSNMIRSYFFLQCSYPDLAWSQVQISLPLAFQIRNPNENPFLLFVSITTYQVTYTHSYYTVLKDSGPVKRRENMYVRVLALKASISHVIPIFHKAINLLLPIAIRQDLLGEIGQDYIFLFLKQEVEEESDRLSFNEGEMQDERQFY